MISNTYEDVMRPFVKVPALCLALVLGGFSLLGCASDPTPASSRTTQEVKGDSDRFFEKMKQEEREQSKEAGRTPR
jgi:hypothetical protein